MVQISYFNNYDPEEKPVIVIMVPEIPGPYPKDKQFLRALFEALDSSFPHLNLSTKIHIEYEPNS